MTMSARPSRLFRRDETASPAPEPPDGDAVGPVGIAVTAVSIVFLAAGIALPEAADTLLRLMLVALALAIVLALAHQGRLPARATADSASPFDGDAAFREVPSEPVGVRELAVELRAADRPRLAKRSPIPRRVRWKVTDEFARRLAERHGLRLGHARDHDQIRTLIAAPTWALIRPQPPVSGAAGTHAILTLSELAMILDDLESL